jgi:hypothetical protein
MIQRDTPRKAPRIGGPYIRVPAGEPFGDLVLMVPIDSEARRILQIYGAAQAVAEMAGRRLGAAQAALADAPERTPELAASAREAADLYLQARHELEAAAGYLVLRMWADPVWQLEARTEYDDGAFAAEEEPALAAGWAAVEELHRELEAGAVFCNAAASALHQRLIPNPSAAEVKKDADFSAAPTEPESG